jgi:uncharacterized protein YcnI
MSLAGTILLVAGATFAVVRPAAGHATLHLFGAHAGAGQAGTITLRIPHGCGSGLSTDRIVTRFDASWLSVAPGDVDGWTATVVRRPRGVWVVTWTATGSGLANDESGDFPLTVTWPATAGDYATPTVQSCGGVTMKWTDRYRGAADGDRPSPAEYPSPFVRVLGALP